MTSFDEALEIAERAVRNNALWCDAVCRSHDRPGTFQEALWINRHGTPRFYPDAVTLADERAASAQLQAISDLIETSRDRAWAVKDSFASLDLTALGFVPLFDAEWIALSGDVPGAAGVPAGHRWCDVACEADLADWEKAWRGDEAANEPWARTFLPRLLDEADVRFVSVRREDRIVGGGILNRGAGVVGLSNCFALDGAPEDIWSVLVVRARLAFPGATLVGYESGADLETARRIGFETVGALRIWCTPDP